jgi:hypothetical protein
VKVMQIYRIARWTVLALSVLSVFLLFKKPQPVATPQPAATVAINAQSFETKLEQLEQPRKQGQGEAEIHLNADEVNAAVAQAAGTIPAAVNQAPDGNAPSGQASVSGTAATAGQAPSAMADFAAGRTPTVKDYQLNFEGDIVRGQFLTEIAGKNVYVTLAGHLGTKDGYATFDPTEFKVGDMNVPVSLVNDALQKKLAEQRDRLKLPEFVGDMKVENGELVMKQK